MHILQINSVYGIGSTGRIVNDLHSIILSKDCKSTVAYGREKAKGCSPAIRIGSDFGNYLHVAKTRFFDAHGFGSFMATKKFIKYIDQLQPDVIHLHNLHGYYIHVGYLFEYLKSISAPVIWTLHDCWSFTGHCSHYDFVACDKWKNACFDCKLKAEYPKSNFIDRSRKNYYIKKKIFSSHHDLTIVTPSRWLMSQVKDSYLKKYRVKVINNGIDIDAFKPVASDFRKRYGLEGKYLILGVASIWSEKKGLQYFIRLLKYLMPDEKIILLGINQKQINALPKGIIAIPKTRSIAELAEIYSAVDVFVNPTLEDTYPTTNLEAISCGTPVITFNSGGSAESVKENCGLVVERGDLEGLINSIAIMRKNKKNYYLENCRNYAISSFNKNELFEEYYKLYNALIK